MDLEALGGQAVLMEIAAAMADQEARQGEMKDGLSARPMMIRLRMNKFEMKNNISN